MKIIDLMRVSHGTAAPLRSHELPNSKRREKREFLCLGILSAHAWGTSAGCCCPNPGSSWGHVVGHVVLPTRGAAQGTPGFSIPPVEMEAAVSSYSSQMCQGVLHRMVPPHPGPRAAKLVRTRQRRLADTWLLPRADGSTGALGGGRMEALPSGQTRVLSTLVGAVPQQAPLTSSVTGRAAGSSSQLPLSGENSPVLLQNTVGNVA